MKLFTRYVPATKLLALSLGAAAGYGYYYYVGCISGTCPISSNPWISTGYGALIGWLAAPRLKPKNNPTEGQNVP